MSRVSYDIDVVCTSLSTDLVSILTSLVTVVGSFIMMCTVSLPLVACMEFTLPLALLFTRYMRRKTRPLYSKRSAAYGKMNGFTEEMFTGQKTILAYAREEVIAAAKAACIHNYIMRLPDGYDTVIRQDGGNISKGQKQLLTIARAMLYNTEMLILDEATSNVDTGTERQVQKAMRNLMRGKTSFVIAHRLSTIQNADKILVVDHGDVVEQGTHESLMEQKSFYYRLYASQFA